jgi:hypothetical protein
MTMESLNHWLKKLTIKLEPLFIIKSFKNDI